MEVTPTKRIVLFFSSLLSWTLRSIDPAVSSTKKSERKFQCGLLLPSSNQWRVKPSLPVVDAAVLGSWAALGKDGLYGGDGEHAERRVEGVVGREEGEHAVVGVDDERGVGVGDDVRTRTNVVRWVLPVEPQGQTRPLADQVLEELLVGFTLEAGRDDEGVELE
eukprot:767858-Hanusia_phi.AAC.9